MDKLEFENFELTNEVKAVDDKQEEPLCLKDDEAIDLSNKIIIALKDKHKEHNKAYPNNKVTLLQLKSVYKHGVAIREQDDKDNSQWAMGRVNMFLRMKSQIGLIVSSVDKKDVPAPQGELIDITAGWLPALEDFLQADKDIEKYGLFNFYDIDELYLDEYKKIDIIW